MNTDNDGSEDNLMPLKELTINKFRAISKRVKLYEMVCRIENYNKTSQNLQKLNKFQEELDLFERSLANAIMQGLISDDDADKRGFETDYILLIINNYVINQDQKVKTLA